MSFANVSQKQGARSKEPTGQYTTVVRPILGHYPQQVFPPQLAVAAATHRFWHTKTHSLTQLLTLPACLSVCLARSLPGGKPLPGASCDCNSRVWAIIIRLHTIHKCGLMHEQSYAWATSTSVTASPKPWSRTSHHLLPSRRHASSLK